jgi:hypothetical protein
MRGDDNGRSDRLKSIIYTLYEIDIRSNIRKREIVDMRKIYSKILLDTGMSLTDIGRTIGKDHSTIIHYKKGTPYLMRNDPLFMRHYRDIYDAFKSFEPEFADNDEADYINTINLDECSDILALSETKVRELKMSEAFLKKENERLKTELDSLMEDLAELRGEKQELVPIMKMIRERTRKGKEDFVFQKINRLFNNIYDS